MAAGFRVGWLVLGIALFVGGVAIAALSVQAFSRIPEAELGDTRDLALGLLSALLAIVTMAAGVGFMLSSRARPPAHGAGYGDEPGGDDDAGA